MAKVVFSLGSNIRPAEHIRAALNALSDTYGLVSISPVYESKSVGFKGDNFLNLVAEVNTDTDVATVQRWCKAYELANGRDMNAVKCSARTIDIDILLYDDMQCEVDATNDLPQLPRPEITHNAFVLKPLADLRPHWLHPELQLSYAELWQQFEQQSHADEQQIWPVAFTLLPA
ncbi:2-amino-4-hydroxy-6-hydroxymethyldihydropteridine diphosphokinase [Aliidiomarina maris]|uniref:2-amino-4-hydroxy-6-hydroxymethyldihydropteridine diphosphokinase n=1 Tax=Aliidiomarina maris TaxID=531312 RepID=A0A327WZ29_9GAMM|nr:2-amino-4-hydroxy-6-hydroxymethyldihydropteridine diphosphokinase [Aliidiomarina maris]MBA3987810.1 2-amino-4-hydroxy-6-hydroxymethyldihydropteridine diphosphokinase [Idiomarina sp.]RAJ95239.1 2-amino-4-hydroxy-6-hydroxymethyldihydropteridine diphosphokinase [Aliidiomarina maris]RUO21063.1 2-amino-4-hydroxy-6-hydroxymethyldihydropteridine diphosphokinase [Aliidiomarina maris]